MDNQMEIAKHRLFADSELHAADVKLFPGISRDATTEQVAEQINKAVAQLSSGNYELLGDEFD